MSHYQKQKEEFRRMAAGRRIGAVEFTKPQIISGNELPQPTLFAAMVKDAAFNEILESREAPRPVLEKRHEPPASANGSSYDALMGHAPNPKRFASMVRGNEPIRRVR